ncbi:Two-component response regulator SSK1p [Malassezia obtusa]|uniref:Two-component response regulator SSK1p n=1 Tax=Malassezia obtusa TaxID=76774 RepID=A0AAF0IU63_9BASI|nr:Two-component response regulator SSK1p [Malassezia obtusa]
MAASQKAYELLSQTLLQCIDSTLQALWQPHSAQQLVPTSAPSLQAVVHTTAALQWLGAWLAHATAATAIPIPEAPVSSSSHVEDLVQMAADIVATNAVANRVQLFLAAPLPLEAPGDATSAPRFLVDDAEMSLPWYPSAYYGVAMHPILVHILSWLVQLSAQDSRVIVLPVTSSHASNARIDFFFDSTLPQDETAWPAWLGAQANLQHVLDELGVMATQGPLKPDEIHALPVLQPLEGATNATYLQVSLRRPRSIDLLSSAPVDFATGAPSLVRLVHALPLEAMLPHLVHKRVRLFPWGSSTDLRSIQLRAYLLDLGCDAHIAMPDRTAHAPPDARTPPASSEHAGRTHGPSTPDSGARAASAPDNAPAATTPDGGTSAATTPDGSAPPHPLSGLPRPQLEALYTDKHLAGVDKDGRALDLILVHNHPGVLDALLTRGVHVPIVYLAPPGPLQRIAMEHAASGVVFVPVPLGYVRLLWALFLALYTYDPTALVYRGRDGSVLPADAPGHAPAYHKPPPPARTSSVEDADVRDDDDTELDRPSASRESSGTSLTELIDEHGERDDDESLPPVYEPCAIPPEDAAHAETSAAPTPASASSASADATSPAVSSNGTVPADPASPETVVDDAVSTPIQRTQEPPDYFTKAVSQLATQPANSGLVIRSADGRAAGIFFHPPPDAAEDAAAPEGADAADGDAPDAADTAEAPPPTLPEFVDKDGGDHESSFDLAVPPPLPPPGAVGVSPSAAESAPDASPATVASPSTELSLSNTTFLTEPMDVALSVTDPVRGEKLYPSGHVMQPVGFETILGDAATPESSNAGDESVSITPRPAAPAPAAAPPAASAEPAAPAAPAPAAPEPPRAPAAGVSAPGADLARMRAMERPPGVERPGAPQSIELPPPPRLPVSEGGEAVRGQPTPYSHLSSKLKRTSAQPQSGLLIGGGAFGAERERRESSGSSGSAAMAAATPGRVSPTVAARLQRRKLALRDDFLPPVKVLIVEDNVINQRILSTFLRKRQIKYEVAKDGREAVDKWRQGDFHLILMDIQLPVLDGIEATKEIRRLERGARESPLGEEPTPAAMSPAARHSVIIVALTASVLSSDRVAALAAGCNDFLNKPVSLPWLQRKILEWGSMQYLLHAGRAALGAPQTPPTPGGARPERTERARKPRASFDRLVNEKAQQVATRLHLSPPRARGPGQESDV